MFYIYFSFALIFLWSFTSSYFTEIENCKITTHGCEYIGTTSITKNGHQCLIWKKEYINELLIDKINYYDSVSIIGTNFCRNPTMFPNGPWCFIDEDTLEWEHCNIPSCIKDRNWCKDTESGKEYIGTLNFTKSGKKCEPWVNQKENSENLFPEKSLNIAGNKCRNPDISESPWCYYSDNYKVEDCDVPKCDENFSQIEYFGGYDFLKLIPDQITIVSLNEVYQYMTVNVSMKLKLLNSLILNKTSLWATNYNPKCQTDLNEYEYCALFESKTISENYIVSYYCFRPLKYLIFISPLEKTGYIIKQSGTLYSIRMNSSEQFTKYEKKMHEHFRKKNKQDITIPSGQNHGHFFLLDDNAIPYAVMSKNKIVVTISTVGNGRIAFMAVEKLVKSHYYSELKDLFQEVYEKPVENPETLTAEYLREIISQNKSKSVLVKPFIWNAHYVLGRDLVNALLQLIKSGLKIIIGVKPWAYYYYEAKFLESELKILFVAAGVWPSRNVENDVWRIVTKENVNLMPLYYQLEYAKKDFIDLKNVLSTITNLFSEVPFEQVINGNILNLLNNSIIVLYSNYLPFIKHLIPCRDHSLTKESDMELIKLFNLILISSFGQKFIAPGLSFYPGKFQCNDISLVNIKMQLNLKYSDEAAQLGLYVLPGEEISVKVTKSKSQSCRLFINFHLFDVSNKEEWLKWPITKTEFLIEIDKLKKFSFPFGGLLSIFCSSNNDQIEVVFHNVVQIPLFDRRNKEDIKDWTKKQTMISPWAILASDTIIFVLSSNAIRNLAQPDSILELYDSMIKEQFHLKGKAITSSRREIISTDIQINAGYMHAGYPIGTQIYWVTNPSRKIDYFFNRHNIEVDGEWGLMHEIGHNLQESIFTFNGVAEVTNNIFTLIAIESMTNQSSWSLENGWLSSKIKIKDLVKYLNNGTFKEWKEIHFLALAIYAQLRSNFGWEFYAQVFRQYDVLKKIHSKISDEDKIQLWIKVTSKISGMNLSPLYELWRWPINDETEKELSKLALFLPDDFLTRLVENRVEEIISKFGRINSVHREPFKIPQKIGPLKNKLSIEGTKVINEIQILD